MNKQKGMTLLEVLVALAIFSLAGLTLLQTTAQQARNAGMMKEKMLASWLADNQQVRLHLNKLWPEKSATGASVTYAGEEWYLSWQGVDTEFSQLRALDIEVRRHKQDAAAIFSLRSYVVHE